MIANASVTSKTVISEPDLLWSNPNPTTGFGAQTVSINLTDYNGVIIKFRKDNSVSFYIYVPKITITSANCPAVADPASTYWVTSSAKYRLVTAISDTGVTFSRGGWSDGTSGNDNLLIPLAIYGAKWTL